MPYEQKEKIYDTLTSDSDKSSNSWDFFAKVSEAFIKAFVVAAAIALAVVLLPGVVVAGIAVTLAVGCVVMTAVPEEKVPSWLQGARDDLIIHRTFIPSTAWENFQVTMDCRHYQIFHH